MKTIIFTGKFLSHKSDSLLALFFICMLGAQPTFSQSLEKMTPGMIASMSKSLDNSTITAWVFFKDKGNDPAEKLADTEAHLSKKNRDRRMRNQKRNNLVDAFDLPVQQGYVRQVSEKVSKIRQRSRWLNAVSVEATTAELHTLSQLDCVMKIDIVRAGRRRPVPSATTTLPPRAKTSLIPHALDYGSSLTQNQMMKVPELHDMGYNGSGVLICVMDAGFNILEHEALDHLNIVATWDFVNNDSNVDDESGQMGTGDHGSWTLSTMAGFAEGNLVGPAYGASFLLAKSENTDSEKHIEEDNWVAAAEWADSLGADIISSSLGYRDDFSDGPDYTWEDMDGKTTIVTIGAEIAASRGILVVNSASNSGSAQPGQNTLGAPSDGPNVLCVGAVDATGLRAGFSSVGPAADGRIKPDVMAMGMAVTTVSTGKTNAYLQVLNGTSFSCPLVAGASALLLQANPGLSNSDIINALRNSGDRADAPDNFYGWGIIDAVAALNVAGVNSASSEISAFTLYPAYPNPFNPRTVISYDLSKASQVALKIFNTLGQEVQTLVDSRQAAGTHSKAWNGRNNLGQLVSSGVYFYRLSTGERVESRPVLFLR